MLAVYGTLVTAVTVIVFAAVVIKFRDPNRPGWMRGGFVEQTVALGFTTAIAMGIGLLAQFIFTLKDQSFGAMEGGLVVAIIAVAVVAWRLMRPMQRLREYEHAKGAGTPAAAAGANPQASGSNGGQRVA